MADHKRKVNIFAIVKSMKVRKFHLVATSLVLVGSIFFQQSAAASTFGAGLFGENAPFGSATSIAVSLDIGEPIELELVGQNFSGSGSHTITVTSTDVVGYKLYVNADSTTAMSNGIHTVDTTANESPSTLSVDSWGYNTTSSTTNFKGMSLDPALIKDADGPRTEGDDTIVTYGVLIGPTKTAGLYTVDITYTAVGED